MERMDLSIHLVEKKSIKGKGELVFWFGRDKNKKKHMITTHGHIPYFYTSNEGTPPTDDRIVKIEKQNKKTKRKYRSYDGLPLKKIYVRNSTDVSGIANKTHGIRDYFPTEECYEDDIPYKIRVQIDANVLNGISVPIGKRKIHYSLIKPCNFFINKRRLHLDIETLTEEGNKIPDVDKALKPVTVINVIDSFTKTSNTFVFKKGLVKSKNDEITKHVSLVNPHGKKYKWIIHIYNKEVDMFRGFLKYHKYTNGDGIWGWNIKKFDIPYMINRMKVLNRQITNEKTRTKRLDYFSLSPLNAVYLNNYTNEYVIKGQILFDTRDAYLSRQTKTVSGSLGNAGLAVIKYGKIKLGCSFNTAYKNKLKLLVYYNAIDTLIDYEIYEKLRQEQYFSGIRGMTGVNYENILSNLQVIDQLLLVKAKNRNIVLPSAREREKIGYIGGYVDTAVFGRSRKVCSFDFKSLYPMIMISFNIGFDTYIGKDLTEKELKNLPYDYISTPNNTYFRRDKTSLIASCLLELIEYRDNIKEELFKLEEKVKKEKEKGNKTIIIELEFEIQLTNDTQTVIKYLTNTIYGIFGNENWRLFNEVIAETITVTARFMMINGKKLLIHMGIKVIYGDTDSLKIQLKSKSAEDMIKESRKIEKRLNHFYKTYVTNKFNLKINRLFIRPETISSTYFMVRIKGSDDTGAKKKYSEGVIVKFILNKSIILKEPEIEITGHIKSNIPIVGNKIIKKVQSIIHEDKSDREIIKLIKSYIRKEINKIISGKYPIKDLCIRVTATKRFDEYFRIDKKTGRKVLSKVEHIDAARWTNQWAYLWDGLSNLGKNSIIHFIYTDENKIPPKYAKTDKVALDDEDYLPDDVIEAIDYDRLIKKTLSPLETSLKELGIQYLDIFQDTELQALV